MRASEASEQGEASSGNVPRFARDIIPKAHLYPAPPPRYYIMDFKSCQAFSSILFWKTFHCSLFFVSSTTANGSQSTNFVRCPVIIVSWKSFTDDWQRGLIIINLAPEFTLCHATWWGENRTILLSYVIFNSTVKKLELWPLPSKSGIPLFIAFSILFQRISGVLDLISFHSLVSGFTPKTYTIFYDNIKAKGGQKFLSVRSSHHWLHAPRH